MMPEDTILDRHTVRVRFPKMNYMSYGQPSKHLLSFQRRLVHYQSAQLCARIP
jgi:hypothetical protein